MDRRANDQPRSRTFSNSESMTYGKHVRPASHNLYRVRVRTLVGFAAYDPRLMIK